MPIQCSALYIFKDFKQNMLAVRKMLGRGLKHVTEAGDHLFTRNVSSSDVSRAWYPSAKGHR